MDERFVLVRQAPATALKSIGAGRLKGKSDINPQWKIEAMSEVYGLCGEGWYHELAKEETFPLSDGQILLFMEVHVYIKDKATGEWSKPIVGFGGDYIYKKEASGLRANDEAKKMCYTDALGNALKNLGVANDVYRGFWDSSKYSRTEESAIQEPLKNVKKIDGETYVLSKNGKYYPLKSMKLEQLNDLANNKRFEEAHDEIRELMSHMG